MKAKTLLIAAAALAAGVVASQAQSPVYSQNIVGYVNTTAPAGQFTLQSNPLDNGTNTLTSLFPTAPNGTLVEIWNGTGFTSATKVGSSWLPSDLTIPPGVGYFAKFSSNTTNTFVGSVVVASGGSVTNTLQAGIFSLYSSPIPYADTLSGTNLNLPQVNGTLVEVWNGTGFTSATKVGASWLPSNLTIQPGQGFFIKTVATTNWVQNLNQ